MKVHKIVKNTNMYREEVLMVWFVGCSFKCEGCFNQHLQDAEAEYADIHPEELLSNLLTLSSELGIDTIMFSGGEPFQQPESELKILFDALRREKIKTIVYTGYTRIELMDEKDWVFEMCDVLLCGRYKGSDNGLQDKEIISSFMDDIEFFSKEADYVSCEVVIEGDKFRLIGYDKWEGK